MIRRCFDYIGQSMYRKFAIIIPLTIIFSLSFPFVISLYMLRKQIHNQLVTDYEQRFHHFAERMIELGTNEIIEDTLLDDALYLEVIKDSKHVLLKSFIKNVTLADRNYDEKPLNKEANFLPQGMYREIPFIEFTHAVKDHEITLGLSLLPIKSILFKATLSLILISILSLFVLVSVIIFIVRLLSSPIIRLAKEAKKIAQGKKKHHHFSLTNRTDEIGYLARNMNGLIRELGKHQKALAEHMIHVEISKIAAQVAHDIRSPLAALSMTIKDIHDKLPEVERISLRSSIKRIQDIANNLSQMKEKKIEVQAQEGETNAHSPQLLSSLTENIISEKRTQYRDRQGISIEEEFTESSYGAFAAVDPVEFKRVISNLVNNAVEALEEKGSITISLSATEKDCTITIRDTGKGIPKDKLARVFDRGVSFGKKGGKGLGLAHAKETLEKWGGDIRIESEVGGGTTVHLILKRAESPIWFLPRLVVKPRKKIIILDDDQSIHDIWKARFRHYDLRDGEIEMIHCTSGKAFCAWYEKQRFAYCHILSDFELLGEKETGLDLIEKHHEGHNSILVTSHCEEEAIKKRCEKIGTRLLPKGLAYLVPIEVRLRNVYDAVFIGDDNNSQLHWKLSAQEHKKTVRCYSNPTEFMTDITILDRNIPIYIEEGFSEGSEGKFLHSGPSRGIMKPKVGRAGMRGVF